MEAVLEALRRLAMQTVLLWRILSGLRTTSVKRFVHFAVNHQPAWLRT